MAAKQFLIGGLVLAVYIQAIFAANFDYSTTSGKGPAKWGTLFPNYCNKSSQSPVNIVVAKTNYDASLGSITFAGYNTVPSGASMQVTNNGHSFSVTVKPNTFTISGGGLTGTYSLNSFHFHWGSDNTKGSEHTVDAKRYPAEMHFVHFNNKYSNLGAAVAKDDGLAVLGVFLEVGSENAALESFLHYAANVTEPASTVLNLTQTKSLEDLLPVNTSDFYRYSGGLTTPNCNEVVAWTVFKNAVTISAAQLNLLRNLKHDNVSKIVNNFRPVQPLNSRIIKTTYKADDEGPDNGARHVTNYVEIIMALIMAAVFFF